MTKTLKTKPTTRKLSPAQQGVLFSACTHADGIATRPAQIKPAQAAKMLAALIEAGLVREMRASEAMPVWRQDEQGRAMAMKILKAGRIAVAGAQPPATPANAEGAVEASPKPGGTAADASPVAAPDSEIAGAPATARPVTGSKRMLIIELMQRKGGATMNELTAATGWLPHTTRAALTGLRRSGIAVELAKGQGGAASSYSVEAAVVTAAA